MDPDRWRQIEHLFHSARELPVGRRATFLAAACDGDDDLRQEVSSLLTESDDESDFLTRSALSYGLPLLAYGG